MVQDAALRLAKLCGVTGELLPQGQRRRVLQVRATDLDDARERARLLLDPARQTVECGQQALGHAGDHGHMHGSGEDVVR
jgi:hypothetical protein